MFKDIRLIERWGSGVRRIIETCIDAGYEEPIFEEIGTHFRVTIPTVQIDKPRLDEIDQLIIKIFQAGGYFKLSLSNLVRKNAKNIYCRQWLSPCQRTPCFLF